MLMHRVVLDKLFLERKCSQCCRSSDNDAAKFVVFFGQWSESAAPVRWASPVRHASLLSLTPFRPISSMSLIAVRSSSSLMEQFEKTPSLSLIRVDVTCEAFFARIKGTAEASLTGVNDDNGWHRWGILCIEYFGEISRKLKVTMPNYQGHRENWSKSDPCKILLFKISLTPSLYYAQDSIGRVCIFFCRLPRKVRGPSSVALYACSWYLAFSFKLPPQRDCLTRQRWVFNFGVDRMRVKECKTSKGFFS
jgi:hypothetical protein